MGQQQDSTAFCHSTRQHTVCYVPFTSPLHKLLVYTLLPLSFSPPLLHHTPPLSIVTLHMVSHTCHPHYCTPHHSVIFPVSSLSLFISYLSPIATFTSLFTHLLLVSPFLAVFLIHPILFHYSLLSLCIYYRHFSYLFTPHLLFSPFLANFRSTLFIFTIPYFSIRHYTSLSSPLLQSPSLPKPYLFPISPSFPNTKKYYL